MNRITVRKTTLFIYCYIIRPINENSYVNVKTSATWRRRFWGTGPGKRSQRTVWGALGTQWGAFYSSRTLFHFLIPHSPDSKIRQYSCWVTKAVSFFLIFFFFFHSFQSPHSFLSLLPPIPFALATHSFDTRQSSLLVSNPFLSVSTLIPFTLGTHSIRSRVRGCSRLRLKPQTNGDQQRLSPVCIKWL